MTNTRPFPGILASLWLTLLGWLLVGLASLAVRAWVTPTAARGIGVALGFGAAGLLAVWRIPAPHAERLGLRGLALGHLLPLALLLPNVFVASEVDNCLRAWVPAAQLGEIEAQTREWLGNGTPLALLEALLVAAGLAPIVEEWFFRGILQQGLVRRLGPVGGVTLTAVLFALPHGNPAISVAAWLAVAGAALCQGLLLGAARLLTGSLLAPILLHAAINAIQIVALFGQDHFSVAGFNAPGAHTPPPVLLPAGLSVLAGLWLLMRSSRFASDAGDPQPPSPESSTQA